MTYEQDNQFEKLARYLDGENVELTPADRELLDEFNRNEAEIAPQLNVKLPENATQRARRRMNAAVLAKPRSALGFRLVGIAGIAAALILGIGLFWANYNKSKPAKSPHDVQVSVEVSDIDADVMFDMVEEQLAMQDEAELLALLEPLYTEDTPDIWGENNGTNNYTDFNGT